MAGLNTSPPPHSQPPTPPHPLPLSPQQWQTFQAVSGCWGRPWGWSPRSGPQVGRRRWTGWGWWWGWTGGCRSPRSWRPSWPTAAGWHTEGRSWPRRWLACWRAPSTKKKKKGGKGVCRGSSGEFWPWVPSPLKITTIINAQLDIYIFKWKPKLYFGMISRLPYCYLEVLKRTHPHMHAHLH